MYGKIFYSSRRKWAQAAADCLLVHVIKELRPKSLLDVGCGDGIWLSVAKDAGVEEVCGLEGHWLRDEDMAIDPSFIVKGDLTEEWKVVRRFDLAMSLEVAEHLPPEAARGFVERLCKAAPVVMFSGAIPGQGGLHHVNEQWQSYWVAIFREQGYELFDVLRPRFWEEERIPYWYRQNTMLFVDPAMLETFPQLLEEREQNNFAGANLVHPRHAERALQFPGVLALLKALPYAIARSFATFFSRGGDAPLPDAVPSTESNEEVPVTRK